MRRNPLQQREGSVELPLGKQINLQLKMIAPLEGIVRDILADEDAGSEEDRFQREDAGQQWKGVFVKLPVGARPHIDPYPCNDTKTLHGEEKRRADETPHGIERPMMKKKFLFILFFDAQNYIRCCGRQHRALGRMVPFPPLVRRLFSRAAGSSSSGLDAILAGFLRLRAQLALRSQFL